jgi:hypothetical protein
VFSSNILGTNPDAKTFPVSSMEGRPEEEDKTDNLNRYNGDHACRAGHKGHMLVRLESSTFHARMTDMLHVT